MKKTFLLVFALILTGACATPPPANREAAPAATAASPAAAAMTETDAIAREKAIWDTIKNKDYDAFANMLADDQIEVTSEAVFDKAQSVTGVKDFEPTEVVFSDWKFLPIDKDAYVITCTAKVKGKYKSKELPEESARTTSAWVSRGGKWLAIYHQESPVKPMTPPPAATKTPATAAASPAATPASVAAAGPDPIANDKMVWELFKAKNYDAFAALLASDFIEVEPEQVSDKAGSLKGVSQFDASKFTQSDFKAVTLDADAMLVTYSTKMAGMRGEGDRHSSIWANRGGKWLAVFHQGGTPITKAPPAAPSNAATSPVPAVTPAKKG
jgi:hypothetical protein